MQERMKKMLKKEKGFTLVELLAVIVILGIVLAIAIPAIGNVIGNSETKAHEANVELIENAARLADVSGGFTGNSMSVSALADAGYLETVPIKPGTETTEYSGTITKSDDGKFTYDDSAEKPK